MAEIRGRFAPSPTGRMHLGNVYCALCAWLMCHSMGGSMVLRIEDLDAARSRPAYAALLESDLRALGLGRQDGPGMGGAFAPYLQSERTALYEDAFAVLQEKGLVYPCFCTRADLHAAGAPHAGDGQLIYDGRCARLTPQQQAAKAKLRAPAWRFRLPETLPTVTDGNYGRISLLRTDVGDCVVRRADGSFAYQLAVVVDDAAMHITQVVRGRDLLASTAVQLALYNALGLTAPAFFHVPLLVAADGRRLSKRDGDLDMGALLARYSPEELLGRLAFATRLADSAAPTTAAELLRRFDPRRIPQENIVISPADFADP